MPFIINAATESKQETCEVIGRYISILKILLNQTPHSIQIMTSLMHRSKCCYTVDTDKRQKN